MDRLNYGGFRLLTQDRLKQILFHDEDCGGFIWQISKGNRKNCAWAGCKNKGYVYIKIDNIKYPAHKLVFLYHEGFYPTLDVDHINGKKWDNRRSNLRLATRPENCQNAKTNINNELNCKNVRLLKDINKYQVRISGKSYGVFENLEEANIVAEFTRNKLHGNFARHR